jgi:RAT1-interacting protein
LVALLKTIISHEEEKGKRIDAHVVTWRGMMTKVRSCMSLLYPPIA